MNSGISPEMTQVIFRFSEGLTYGLTPVMAYFIIYLAYMEKYNQDATPISLFTIIKYQLPYSIVTGIVLILMIQTEISYQKQTPWGIRLHTAMT